MTTMTNDTIAAYLFLAIGVSLLPAAAVAGQSSTARRMPAALRAHVQDERFQAVTSVRGLPLGVRDELQALFGSTTLDIAEPGAEFRMTSRGGNPNLPLRRLAAAGCSADHCLVYYERGGTAHTWHVALFRWTPAATSLEGGGPAPAGLTTLDDVRRAVLAGGRAARFW